MDHRDDTDRIIRGNSPNCQLPAQVGKIPTAIGTGCNTCSTGGGRAAKTRGLARIKDVEGFSEASKGRKDCQPS